MYLLTYVVNGVWFDASSEGEAYVVIYVRLLNFLINLFFCMFCKSYLVWLKRILQT